jgi:hypothetical protein
MFNSRGGFPPEFLRLLPAAHTASKGHSGTYWRPKPRHTTRGPPTIRVLDGDCIRVDKGPKALDARFDETALLN